MVDNVTNIEKIPIIVVVGATATGKTRLAIEIAKAKDGEVISADSMQIYKGMNIGTAKPNEAELKEVPHHLVDFLDMSKDFSVAQYKKLADEAIINITNRCKAAVLAGGTGLYINTVVDNISFLDSASDDNVRKSLWAREKAEGIESLYAELSKIDIEYAKKIDYRNKKRVIRALEIYIITGKTMSEQLKNSKKTPSPYEPTMIGLDYRDRDKLYDKINQRVDLMMKQGLLKEAIEVLNCDNAKTAMGAIGYKELFPYIKGEINLEDAVENLKKSTRHYAKRQLTWFKRDTRINWIYIDDYSNFNEIIEVALKIIG